MFCLYTLMTIPKKCFSAFHFVKKSSLKNPPRPLNQWWTWLCMLLKWACCNYSLHYEYIYSCKSQRQWKLVVTPQKHFNSVPPTRLSGQQELIWIFLQHIMKPYNRFHQDFMSLEHPSWLPARYATRRFSQ